MGSECSTIEDIYRSSDLFLIENLCNVLKNPITITCKYCDNDTFYKFINNRFINNLFEFLREPKDFILLIKHRNKYNIWEEMSVKILPENTKCIIFLNENDKLCFIIK